MRRLSIKFAFPLILGLSGAVAVACGENNEPTDEDGPTDISSDGGGEPGSGGNSGDGSGATSNNDGAGGATGGNATDGSGSSTNNNGGEGGITGSGGIPGSGGFIQVDLPDCDEEPNGTFPGQDNPIEGEVCWDHEECKGVASEQFLNRCSGTCLQPFDNEERIVGFDGTLPPL